MTKIKIITSNNVKKYDKNQKSTRLIMIARDKMKQIGIILMRLRKLSNLKNTIISMPFLVFH
jgi:hypothetical protein